MSALFRLFLLVTVICVLGIGHAEEAPAKAVPASIHTLQGKGIENFYQVTPRLYSGSAPEGEEGFAELKARGIKTIITVDGAKPDVETARKFGMKYVHLPIGYDGVPTNQAVRLVKAAETLPGPVFIHCHHGLHRGPAAAAVICMAGEGWTPDQAVAWLKLAGTAPNYTGLYKSVEYFQPPSAAELKLLPDNFPEKSQVSHLADVMVEIDEYMEHLKMIKKAGYKAPAANPDLDPAHEALMLQELLKELLRHPVTDERGKDFRSKLMESEQAMTAFHQRLKNPPIDVMAADKDFKRVTESCTVCHKAHRN